MTLRTPLPAASNPSTTGSVAPATDPVESGPGSETISSLSDTNAIPDGICQRIAQHHASNKVGDMLGKYLLIDVLGHGGMGVVFSAFDPVIERNVAIKLLPEELAQDQAAVSRFLAEAKAVGRLNHPNVVAIHEIDRHEDCPFLVMEFVDGGSTDINMRHDGAYTPYEATRIISQACAGLQAAHEADMIHRDIKPGNILLSRAGGVKLADFGLVASPSISSEITMDGEVMGTPYFMSPEQCQSEDLDHRSDIYALGATYYSLLTGLQPYASHGAPLQIMFAHCDSDVPDPRDDDPEIPEVCVELLQRAMAKSPSDRFQSALEMQAAFEDALQTLSSPTDSGAAVMPAVVTSSVKKYSTRTHCPHAVQTAAYVTAAVAATGAVAATAYLAACCL